MKTTDLTSKQISGEKIRSEIFVRTFAKHAQKLISACHKNKPALNKKYPDKNRVNTIEQAYTFFKNHDQEVLDKAQTIISRMNGGKSLSELSKLDTVNTQYLLSDLMALESSPIITYGHDKRVQRNILNVIPCFEEGIIENSELIIYFKLLNIDLSEQTADIQLVQYTKDPESKHKRIFYTTKCIVKLTKASEPEVEELENRVTEDAVSFIKEVKNASFDEQQLNNFLIYTFGVKTLSITDKHYVSAEVMRDDAVTAKMDTIERNIWKITTACLLETSPKRANETDSNALHLIMEYAIHCCTANLMLSETREYPKNNQTIKKHITYLPKPEEYNNNPVVINLNGIQIKSRKRPIKVTRRNIIEYKTASWGVRGHVRHYKNGKTVYIKPYTCKRQKVKLPENSQPQKIINI